MHAKDWAWVSACECGCVCVARFAMGGSIWGCRSSAAPSYITGTSGLRRLDCRQPLVLRQSRHPLLDSVTESDVVPNNIGMTISSTFQVISGPTSELIPRQPTTRIRTSEASCMRACTQRGRACTRFACRTRSETSHMPTTHDRARSPLLSGRQEHVPPPVRTPLHLGTHRLPCTR